LKEALVRTGPALLAAAVLAGCSTAAVCPPTRSQEPARAAPALPEILDDETLHVVTEVLQHMQLGGGCAIPVC
jgi:hypothetical protein